MNYFIMSNTDNNIELFFKNESFNPVMKNCNCFNIKSLLQKSNITSNVSLPIPIQVIMLYKYYI